MSLLSSLFPPAATAGDVHDGATRRELVILDVREPAEWKAGHAPGATNLPLSSLDARQGELRGDRRYAAVCRTGARSRVATARLRRAGYDVVNVKGGMHAWTRAGLPLEPRRGRIV